MLMGMLSGGLVIHGVAYLELPPTGAVVNNQTIGPYMCTNTTDPSMPMYPCVKPIWCNNLNQTGLKVSPKNVNY